MGCEISIIPGKQIVVSRFSGPITIEDRGRNRRETIDFCKEKGIRNVIVDTRGQVSCSSTMDIFGFGETIPETTRGFRIAIVRDCKETDVKFIENVAANRGAITNSFVSFDKAQEWLESMDSTHDQHINSNKQ